MFDQKTAGYGIEAAPEEPTLSSQADAAANAALELAGFAEMVADRLLGATPRGVSKSGEIENVALPPVRYSLQRANGALMALRETLHRLDRGV